jgi:RHS repeat-associated protein
MASQRESLLCRYRYDALDQVISHALSDEPDIRRFYCKSRLATEIKGALQHSIFQQGDQLLAQQQREGDSVDATLLATDQQRSVVHTLKNENHRQPVAYSPYGHRSAESGLTSLLGFNGERPDPVTGHYLLGNGYRAFNPVLMRFNSPDSLSPFGKGGVNSYAYCLGDPINLHDPDGHSAGMVAAAFARWRRFAAAKVATRIEIAKIETTNTIKMIGLWSQQASLKSGVSPAQAIEARNRIAHLSHLGSDNRRRNAKYLHDLSQAKKESALIEKHVGIPAGQNERLKTLSYLKGGESGEVFSIKRLWDADLKGIEPQTPINRRPNIDDLIRYKNEINNIPNTGLVFLEEAYRIRGIYFQ